MKNYLLLTALFLSCLTVNGQTKTHKFGITSGGSIQHYNGNLGNSFFKFNTTCFSGVSTTFGKYLNKSFDINLNVSVGHFGYCQTDEDAKRVVSFEERCTACNDREGMGELRSLMISGNIALKYKLANDYFLKENAKLAPYFYTGMGINHLSDVMKRNCVNVGYHFTLNCGAGVKYNITERLNISYNLGFGCFMTKKVYYTNSLANGNRESSDSNMQKRKDMYMQNSIVLGVNF